MLFAPQYTSLTLTCFSPARTRLLQLASLILFVSIPKQQVWILFHFVTSKSTFPFLP